MSSASHTSAHSQTNDDDIDLYSDILSSTDHYYVSHQHQHQQSLEKSQLLSDSQALHTLLSAAPASTTLQSTPGGNSSYGDETYAEVYNRAAAAEKERNELRQRVEQLEKENKRLLDQNTVLKKNISCLFNTAKQELKRKTLQIDHLQKDIDRLIAK